jgi:hypothetical protein
MLFAAKCFWPGITPSELERAAGPLRAARAVRANGAIYAGSLLFVEDSLVLCLFDAESATAVRGVAESAHIPCERVMPIDWLPRPGRGLIRIRSQHRLAPSSMFAGDWRRT